MNRIHFKYFKNILISRFYKQFSRNGSAMAPEQLFEKISNFKNMNVLYIILKHVVWRFQIFNYFRDFMNTLRNFAKSVFAHIFAKFEYFVKVIIIRNLQTTCFKMIYNMFILKFFRTAVPGPFRENCS